MSEVSYYKMAKRNKNKTKRWDSARLGIVKDILESNVMPSSEINIVKYSRQTCVRNMLTPYRRGRMTSRALTSYNCVWAETDTVRENEAPFISNVVAYTHRTHTQRLFEIPFDEPDHLEWDTATSSEDVSASRWILGCRCSFTLFLVLVQSFVK